MIYVFSSLIVLAGGGILAIVWKHYGSFIKSKIKELVKEKNLPKLPLGKVKVFFSKIKVKDYFIKTNKIKNNLKTKSVPKKDNNNRLKEDKNNKKGVHVSSLLGERGEQFWIEVIKSDPQNPHPYKKLGEWYLNNDKAKFAKETFEYASRLDPDDADIKRYLDKLSDKVKG